MAPPSDAESPYIYGFHSWSPGCDLDVMSGKTGWYVRYQIIWEGISLSTLQQAKGEGFTIIMGLFDDWEHEIPTDRDRWPAFAAQCAAVADYVRDYCHIFHLDNEMDGNELNPNTFVECFRMVRDAIKAVNPDAIVSNGGVLNPNWFEPMARRLGDEIDGYQSHVHIPPDCMEILESVPGAYRKPYYITEFTNALDYPTGWLQSYYADHNDWNVNHDHKSACACWFVYDLCGWYSYSLKYLPQANADYEYVTSHTEYTNEFAERPITISDVRIDILSSSSAAVSWKTDIASTTQVEWYADGATQGRVTSFDTRLTTEHSATFSGCVPNYKYYLVARSTAQGYGDAAERFAFGTNTSWSPSGWLRAGWNLISLPLEPADPRAEKVFDTVSAAGNIESALFTFDGEYRLYPADFTEVHAGRGYWILLDGPASEYCEGLASSGEVSITLTDGWNLIGQPHNYPTALASCKVTDGAATLSFDAAVDAGWIADTAYYYHGDGYSTCRTWGGDDDSLRPWYGYWVLAYRAGLTLVIP